MANALISKNPPSSRFGVADLALHRDVETLVELGGAPFVTAMLIELGGARLVRTEIDSLLQRYRLILGPPKGSA